MPAKKCPVCKLLHPADALTCECGYDFTAQIDHSQLAGLLRRATARAPFRSTILAGLIFALGVVLAIAGPVIMAAAAGAYISRFDPIIGVISCLYFFVVGAAVFPRLVPLLLRFARRVGAAKASRVLLADLRRPTLYLRSFDRDSSHPHACDPLEDRLAPIFQKFGPLLAIGRPGERLTTPGASRLYIADSYWQEVVSKLMAESQAIVYVHGNTTGLAWELDQLSRTADPRRVLFVIPPFDPAVQEQLILIAERILRCTFPRSPDAANGSDTPLQFFMFSHTWSPIYLAIKIAPSEFEFDKMSIFTRFSFSMEGVAKAIYWRLQTSLKEEMPSIARTLKPFTNRLASLPRSQSCT